MAAGAIAAPPMLETSSISVQTNLTNSDDLVKVSESQPIAEEAAEGALDLQNVLKSLQQQISNVLETVGQDRLDLDIGQTHISRDKALILSWSKNKKNIFPLQNGFTQDPKKGDGILFYCALRFKPEFCNDVNNNKEPPVSDSKGKIPVKKVSDEWMENVKLQRKVDLSQISKLFVRNEYYFMRNVPEKLLKSDFPDQDHKNKHEKDGNSKKREVHWKEDLISTSSPRKLTRSRSVDRDKSTRVRLSNTRRYRSLSPVYDGPIGILTSESPKSKKENSVSASSSSSSTVLTAPLVRRLRSKVKVRTNSLWFTGKTPNSFNSLCSSRYDRKELQTGSKHYFFYQVLPRAQKG